MDIARKFRLQAIALAALVASASASADVVQWTFDDAIFTNGGTLTGSFNFDVDTGTLSDVNVLLTNGLGSIRPDLDPVGPDSLFVTGKDLSGNFGLPAGSHVTLLDSLSQFDQFNWLALFPVTPLSDAGGVVALTTDTNVADPSAQLEPHGELQMFLTSGSLVGTPVGVPEPASIAVLLLGLGALGWKMRRPAA